MVATATAVSNRDPSDSGSDSRRVRRLRALAAQLPQQPRRPAAAALESEGAAGAATEVEDHVLVRLRGAHERPKDPKPRVDISGPGTDKRRKGYGLTTRDNTPLPALNSFGVSTVLPGFGVLPKKVTDFAQARDLLRRDGAVILSGLTTELGGMHAFRDTAESLPGRLFGDELLGDNSPGALVGIVDGASNLEGKDAEPVREFYRQNWGEEVAAFPPWGPNCAHTDGDAFGDLYPPFVCLLFAHQSEDGGENALVDAAFVLDEMEHGTPELQRTAALLRTVPVDQAEYGADELTMTGAPCVSPIVQMLPGGRTMLKCMTGYQRPATAVQKQAAKAHGVGTFAPADARAQWEDPPVDAEARDAAMITCYKDAIIAATQHAPRFKVLAGEALLMDNYRCMHVREGYADLDRRSWRVFMWAEGDCFGVPEVLERDSNMTKILPDAMQPDDLPAAVAPPRDKVPRSKLFG